MPRRKEARRFGEPRFSISGWELIHCFNIFLQTSLLKRKRTSFLIKKVVADTMKTDSKTQYDTNLVLINYIVKLINIVITS
jgi:hypothetical protein